MQNKRGQSASGAAILIIVIAVLIILYIIILNPEDRAALLGGGEATSDEKSAGQPTDNRYLRQGFQTPPGGQVLLQETPGRLYPEGSSLLDHPLPSFTIFTKINARSLKHIDHAYVKNSFLGKTKYNLSFLYDPATMHNPLLSFLAEEYDGMLRVYLNNELIYERTLTSPTPPPIPLPEEYLRLHNDLRLETNTPGIAFWRIHEFSIHNILVTADVKDIQASTAEHHFTLPENEYEHVAYLELTFTPNCDPRVAGRLILRVNDKPLSSSYPECGDRATLQISKDLLQGGDNTLFFLSEQSAYLIDQVNMRSILASSANPTYYFNLPMELYTSLGGQLGGYAGQSSGYPSGAGGYGPGYGGYPGGGYGPGGYPGYGGPGGYPSGMPGGYGAGGYPGAYGSTASLIIITRFPDATTQKVLTLNINGFQNTIETTDLSYSTLIPPEYLIDGPNSVQLIPQGSSLDVVELRVEVQQAG